MKIQRSDYYVYVHRRLNDNIVFYVGKGTRNRAFQGASQKTQAWKQSNNSGGGHTVEILETSLTNDSAISLENYLLTYPPANWELINKAKAQNELDYDSINFSDYFYYDETSHTGLRWKIDSKVNGGYKYSIGCVAGSIYNHKHDGRSLVRVDSVSYYAHRVIWKMFNPDIVMKGLVVNHIDNNPANNRIENLELVTQEINSRRSRNANGKLRPNNSTGINGVTMITSVRKDGVPIEFAVAQWRNIGGSRESKAFSCVKYGSKENALKLASEYRLTKLAENEINNS